MGLQTKIDRYITREELPGVFRELADALEGNGAGELACADDFFKLKVGVRDEFGQLSLRIKFKTREACVANEDQQAEGRVASTRPDYKDLKKRMKQSFKVVFQMIHSGRMPPKQAVRSFLEDSALMVTYPGYGDPEYEAYSAACAAFEAAFDAGDLGALNETVDALAHLKGHCHSNFG